MTLFFRYFGLGSRYEEVQSELGWPEAAGWAGLLTLISCLLLLLFGGASRGSDKRFCPDCQTVDDARPGDLLACQCGGTFETLDRWKWRTGPPR